MFGQGLDRKAPRRGPGRAIRPKRRKPASQVWELAPDRVLSVIEWLASNECHDLDDAGFVAGLGRRLRAIGLPLDRLALHLRTLHPEILGRSILWGPGAAVEIHDREHGLDLSPDFVASPLRRVMETRKWITVRMDDPRFADGLHHQLFGGCGLSQLVMAPLVNADGPISAVAFATRRPAGFAPVDMSALRRLVPTLRSACELRTLRAAETTLLDTYLGPATGRRILDGHVRRGDVESVEAAFLLCDLRDFTALSDRLPSARVLELLNIYFDQVVPAITGSGGEILKFLGDAALAFFRRDADPAASCAAAFEAARIALARLEALVLPDFTLRAGIALHYGTVSYGNIGSGHRLDFTMIGRDVNFVSRIQAACAATGASLLMSARCAQLLAREDVFSIGPYPLKGFDRPPRLFAWIKGNKPSKSQGLG